MLSYHIAKRTFDGNKELYNLKHGPLLESWLQNEEYLFKIDLSITFVHGLLNWTGNSLTTL
jgi:hypothetical protein